MSNTQSEKIDKSLFNSCICWLEYQLVYNKKVNSTPESKWSPTSITSFDACKSIVTNGINTLPLEDNERDWAEYILYELYLNKLHQNEGNFDSADLTKMPKNYIETAAWGTLRNLKRTWFSNSPNKCSCFSNEMNK
jgi:hypothetical protein